MLNVVLLNCPCPLDRPNMHQAVIMHEMAALVDVYARIG